ncbi:hypothetical protein [Nitrosomonas sp.]|uniref:hypothetical protein n=1 Tax=Nitrosomonas sp. TaxID=42353 RepID=UPI002731BB84|nr:hypothetical protein [Nitrosomonas sp.]MDP1786449.1 hypothetical protein [Nitrosomonas sp.]
MRNTFKYALLLIGMTSLPAMAHIGYSGRDFGTFTAAPGGQRAQLSISHLPAILVGLTERMPTGGILTECAHTSLV